MPELARDGFQPIIFTVLHLVRLGSGSRNEPMMETSWSDLLEASPIKPPPQRRRGEGLGGIQPSPTRTRTRPPGGKVGSKKNVIPAGSRGSGSRVQVEALRSQVARLLREKRELEERGRQVRGGPGVANTAMDAW